jgi:hypothetical protein
LEVKSANIGTGGVMSVAEPVTVLKTTTSRMRS